MFPSFYYYYTQEGNRTLLVPPNRRVDTQNQKLNISPHFQYKPKRNLQPFLLFLLHMKGTLENLIHSLLLHIVGTVPNRHSEKVIYIREEEGEKARKKEGGKGEKEGRKG